ncbi:hypothetical protein ACJJTC_012998 [Scirpophaga incertulas]
MLLQNVEASLREAVSASADSYVAAWWSACGGLAYGACGGMTLLGWRNVPPNTRRTRAYLTATCSLATAAVLTIDALLSFCFAKRDDNAGMRTKHRKPIAPCS